MGITEFNAPNAKMFRDALKQNLREFGEQFGIEVKAEGMRLDNMQALSFKITAAVGEIEHKDTPSGRLFLSYGPAFGFKSGDLGRSFKYKRELYKITGWCGRSHKYKILTERLRDRTVMRFTPDHVLEMLR